MSLISLLLSTVHPVADAPPAVYISPAGAGRKDGADWSNAAPITALGSMIALARTIGGDVLLRADQGAYNLSETLSISQGGTSSKIVNVRGVSVTGAPMYAEFQSNRLSPKWAPGGTVGLDQIWLNSGASNLKFSFMRFRDVGTSFRLRQANTNLTFEDIDAVNVRRLIQNNGENAHITGFVARRCTGFGFSKQFIQLRYNSSNLLLEDCYADADRQDGDLWSTGFVLDDTAHDVIMRRCIAKNCYYDAGPSNYWNADGFSGERGNYGILLEDCEAYDCTDGGYDFKSQMTLLRCKGQGNKRNFRMWGRADLIDCVGINPFSFGGSGSYGQVYAYDRSFVRVQGGTWTWNNTITDAAKAVFTVFEGGLIGVDAAAQAAVIKPSAVAMFTNENREDAISTTWDHNDVTRPTINGNLDFTLDENKPMTIEVTASEPVSVAVSGPDAAKCSISGRRILVAPQDYEKPGGPAADGTKVLKIDITATDVNGNQSPTRRSTVTILDVADDPIGPAEAFAYSGANGAWFNISDLSTLWADTARTIPAVVDGPVAVVDDQSGSGNHMVQANPDKQAILRQQGFTYYLEMDGAETFYNLGAPGGFRYPQFTVVSAVKREPDTPQTRQIVTFFGRRGTTASLSTNGTFWMGFIGGVSVTYRMTSPNGTSNGVGSSSTNPVVLSFRSTDGIMRSSSNGTTTIGMTTVVDGTDVASNSYPLATEQPLVGARYTPESGYLEHIRCRFYGLVIMNKAADDATRFRVERQLGRNAGLPL